jgi:hypothetical protein
MGLAVGEIPLELIQARWGCQPEKLSQAHGKFYTRAKNPWSARAEWRDDSVSLSRGKRRSASQSTNSETNEEE